MVLTVVLAALLATTPAVPQPTQNQQEVLRQPMLAEPTTVYSLADKKKKKRELYTSLP